MYKSQMQRALSVRQSGGASSRRALLLLLSENRTSYYKPNVSFIRNTTRTNNLCTTSTHTRTRTRTRAVLSSPSVYPTTATTQTIAAAAAAATATATTTTTSSTIPFPTRSFATQSSGQNQRERNAYNNNNNNNRRNRKQTTTMSIHSIIERMEKLRRKNKEWILPPIWSAHNPAHNTQEQTIMLQATRKLLQALEQSISDGHINYQGRESQNISAILNTALDIFKISYDDSLKVLKFAKALRLELSHHRRDSIIYAACGAGKWSEAATIFRDLVDPDIAGYTPVDIDVANPSGLYAITKRALQSGDHHSVAEQVMDAVMSMSMVSPTDQEKYILAAGNALGRAGVWKSLLDYYRNSINSSKLGQPLVAASMHACIINGKRQQAIQLFDDFVASTSISSEWQWDGGAHALSPLTRDLAMRAGHPSSLKLFEESQKEHYQVSTEAVLGVLGNLSNWKDVLSFFSKMIDRQGTGWLADGDSLTIQEHVMRDTSSASDPDEQRRCDRILEAVAVTFNTNQQFSTSLICVMLYHKLHNRTDTRTDWHDTLTNSIRQTSCPNDFLIAVMTSLCGLSAPESAHKIYDTIVSTPHNEVLPYAVTEIHDFATDLVARCISKNKEIVPLLENIDFLLHKACEHVEGKVVRSDVPSILRVLARTMQSLSMVNQPQASLFILEMMLLSLATSKSATHKGKMGNLFLTGATSNSTIDSFLKLDDTLLTEVVRALRIAGLHEEAMGTFERGTANDSVFPPYSTQQMLQVLVDVGQTDDAIDFFKSLPSESRTPESFFMIGTLLENEARWGEMRDLYHLAKKEGCLSEGIVFLAMKGVEKSDLQGKMKVFRMICNDASKLVGTEPREWLDTRYWTMKRELGDYYSQLLMWWNDKKICGAKEFELAINQLYERRKAGLKSKNDVLRSIVLHCINLDRIPDSVFSWKQTSIPQTEQALQELLFEVVGACEETNLCANSRFMTNLISALLSRGFVAEATQVLARVTARGVLLDENTIKEVLDEAARRGVPVPGNVLTLQQ